MRDDFHVRVERAQPRGRGREFGRADVRCAVQNLALQIRDVDRVEVHEPDRADARGGEIERRRRPEAARADDEHAPLAEALLPHFAELRKNQVAVVPPPFV